MNNRRKLFVAIGASAFTVPRVSFAQQQGRVWRVGILSDGTGPAELDNRNFGPFVKALRDLGYAEGRNVTIEWRFADGKYERLQGLAEELVKLNVDVIVTSGTPPILAARRATTTIPIVASSFGDPVGSGIAASLAHPGGNVTGNSNLSGDLDTKRLELLTSVVPKVTRIAQLVNPDNPSTMKRIQGLRAAAKKTGREFLPAEIRAAGKFEETFSLIARQRAGALMVSNDGFLSTQGPRIAELALRYKLPTIFGNRAGAEAGGLMSYAVDYDDLRRRTAIYVDKIFKGAKAGDLPIEQPNKFELVFNLKTAKVLGVKIPDVILLRADKVIE